MVLGGCVCVRQLYDVLAGRAEVGLINQEAAALLQSATQVAHGGKARKRQALQGFVLQGAQEERITCLNDVVGNNLQDLVSFVGVSTLGFARAQFREVFHRLGNNVVCEFNNYSTNTIIVFPSEV